MNRKIQWVLLTFFIMVLILSTAGCSDRNTGQSPETTEAVKAGEVNPQSTGQPNGQKETIPEKDYFAVYAKGRYSEELFRKQQGMGSQDQPITALIGSERELKALIGKYSLEAETAGQDIHFSEEFFKTNRILAVFPPQCSRGVFYAVTGIDKKGGKIYIKVEQNMPEQTTDDIISRCIFVALNDKYREGIGSFDVKISAVRLPSDKTPIDDLSIEDLRLGDIGVKLSPEELDSLMGKAPEKVQREQNNIAERRFYDGIEIVIKDNEVSLISTTSGKYLTPRGLKVGDSVKKLVELYGKPSQIQDSIYSFDLSGDLFLFHAEVREGKIIRLQVNLGY